MKVLIIAEHDNKTFKSVNFNVLSAALNIADTADFWLAGNDCGAIASVASQAPSIGKVLCADNPALEHQLAEDLAPLIVNSVKTGVYTHVIVGATTFGKNILPRIGALLDAQPISDVIECLGDNNFNRPIYAGNSIATVKSLDSIVCLSVRGPSFASAPAQGGAAPVEEVASLEKSTQSNFVSDELTKSERPELSAAKIIFSGGRGMGNGENFDMLYRLADKTGGAVGASRAAVDAGFVPNDMQVGQTGKIVAPDLYVAVGLSGAIQHLAGMKDSKVIVAINKDEDAPIFQVADYGLVADLFVALPELEAELNK